MRNEAQNYVVGMETKHGIIKLEVGKTYTQEDAIVRATQLNENCKPELMALRGISFVAICSQD